MRIATFDYAGVDQGDVDAMELAWNSWVADLRLAGYEPAETAKRWTDTSITYRVFEVAQMLEAV